MKPRKPLAVAFPAFLAAFTTAAFAQQPPSPPPSWQQGRGAEQASSPLHPFAIEVTGKSAKQLPVDKLKVPAGFKVEVWVDGAPGARSMALGDKGTVFVGTRQLKDVYAVVERGGKREVKTILKGLESPNGIVFSKGTLYVAVGAPGNIVMPAYFQASINRVDPNKGVLENVAMGVRNSVGFDWHPQTKQLWFTEHGRDWLGDNSPSDELNVVKAKGEHFGYPYCHQGDTLDPEFGKYRSCSEFTPPVLKLGAHVAPIGMRFYTGKMFPAEYRNNIFIARRGSWNRTVKQGYDVFRVRLNENGKVLKAEPFLTGFLVDEKADPPMWGRPADVMVMRDGSLLVSDDHNGIIYRVSYGKR